jgi:hypothetical protein
MDGMSAEFTPMHISVDGSLANPHMLIAVILWALVLGAVAAVVVSLFARARRTRAAVGFVLLVALSGLTPWTQLGLAWATQTIAARRMISTTFFYPPPGWLAPLAGIPLGITAGLVIIRQRHRGRPRTI